MADNKTEELMVQETVDMLVRQYVVARNAIYTANGEDAPLLTPVEVKSVAMELLSTAIMMVRQPRINTNPFADVPGVH